MKLQVCKVLPPTVLCPKISAPTIDGHIDEKEWAKATRLTRFIKEDGGAPVSRTTIWLGRDEGYLYVAARCEERNTKALQLAGFAYSRELWYRDHIDVLINASHDHITYCRFTAGPFEQTDVARGTCRVSYDDRLEARWFHNSEKPDFGLYLRYASAVEEGRAWCCEMAIPFESIGIELPEAGKPWGINLRRYTAFPVYQGPPTPARYPHPGTVIGEWSSLSVAPGLNTSNPLAYADMVFDERDAQLVEADFGTPHFGINRTTVHFKAPVESDLVLAAYVRPLNPGRIIDAGGEFPLRSDGKGSCSGEFTWKAANSDDVNVLDLAVKSRAEGRTLWRGTYDFGWEGGSLPLTYLHKGETGGPMPNPAPHDPDFLGNKVQYIASRQARFYRRNTAQGALSDFALESDDGSVRFNLMDPACVKEMAKYVHDCYDNDADRLLGMMFFAGQAAMMRVHPAYDPDASHRMETLSLLRFGSGYCGHMSRVMAVILNEMEIGNTGRKHCARSFGIGGHALNLVEYRGDYAILDSKHMTLFYLLDNSDLATLKELRAEPEIGRRAFPLYMAALMTFNADHIKSTPPTTLDGTGMIYPQGAPTKEGS